MFLLTLLLVLQVLYSFYISLRNSICLFFTFVPQFSQNLASGLRFSPQTLQYINTLSYQNKISRIAITLLYHLVPPRNQISIWLRIKNNSALSKALNLNYQFNLCSNKPPLSQSSPFVLHFLCVTRVSSCSKYSGRISSTAAILKKQQNSKTACHFNLSHRPSRHPNHPGKLFLIYP